MKRILLAVMAVLALGTPALAADNTGIGQIGMALGANGIVSVVQLVETGHVKIEQTGAGNRLGPAPGFSHDTSESIQSGNTATKNNIASVLQADMGTASMIAQLDIINATAAVEQTGANGFSSIVQQNSSGPGGLYAEIHQTTEGDRSFIVQSGTLNNAFVFQTEGSGSSSSIAQSGAGNLAAVHQ